jgi:hypothetical protein
MAVRQHPTKGDGYWQIVISNGRNSKQHVSLFKGTKEEAKRHEMFIKAGIWEGVYQNIESSMSKMKYDEKKPPFIYFIQQGNSGPIKIGYTKYDLYARFKRLQTGNPLPLRVLAIIDGADTRTEISLHTKFSSCRLNGEWFAPTDELMKFINEIRNRSHKLELERIYKEYLAAVSKLADNEKVIAIEALQSGSLRWPGFVRQPEG